MRTEADRGVRRLVVRPPNWLGDAVLALPALTALRRHFADAEITIAGVPAVAALFREHTTVQPDRVLELPSGSPALIAALRGEAFDTGVLLPNSFRSAWQFWRAGIPARWGFGTSGRSVLLTRRIPRPRRRRHTHHAEYYNALVRGLGTDDPGSALPDIRPSPASVQRAESLLAERKVPAGAPLVAFAPGAAYGAAKQWAPERVAQVVAEIVRARGATAVIVGALHDRDTARAIESWLRAHAPDARAGVVDLVGRTTLGALVGVAARARVFVSNDSGAMHVAAAVGRPVVALFGPTDERATRPLGDHDVLTAPAFCRPCLLRECPIDHRCMKRLDVPRVVAAVLRRFDASAA